MAREDREVVTALTGFPAFAGSRPDDLRALVEAGSVTTLPAQWALLHEGTPADAVYVLLEGEAQVRLAGRDMPALRPGAVVGEMALLGHSLRSADVVTTSRVRVLRVDYDALQALFAARPGLEATFGTVYRDHQGS